MSSFYVGQRVKVVACDVPEGAHLVGLLGIVNGQLQEWETGDGMRLGYSVRLDPCKRFDSIWKPHELAPATPPHQPADADFIEQFRTDFAPSKTTEAA